MFLKTVKEAGLAVRELEFAVTSGMITSEIGLIELPHLWTPAGIEELAAGIEVVRDPDLLSAELPLIFIRGIKNHYSEGTTYRDIRRVDFMRGEETQAVGLISARPDLSFPLILVVMGSHTKYIYLNKDKKVSGSLTTISGQIYEAVIKHTIVGKSIATNDNNCTEDRASDNDGYFTAALTAWDKAAAETLDTEVIDTAYDSVKEAGFLRSLLMPRFMDVLLGTESRVRELFITSVIIADDLRALNDFKLLNFNGDCSFFLVGQRVRCQVMAYLLKKYCQVKGEVSYISDKKRIDCLSIIGAAAIARQAGYLGKGSSL